VSAPRLAHFRGPVEAVYVRYRDGEREFYDLARDPYERTNRARTLSAAQRGELDRLLSRLARCHGTACWSAATVTAQRP
jgi:N-acetylglucosamine-6-sulfatase